MKLLGLADKLTTILCVIDTFFDLDDDEIKASLSTTTTSLLLSGAAPKDIKEVQARVAQAYIDSLSTEQLIEFDELLKQKEMEMISKESYNVSLNNNLVAKVPKLNASNKVVEEKSKIFKKC